jgi:phage tail tape-measure protein
VDEALLRAISVSQRDVTALISEPLVLRRMRLPARRRRRGNGIRSRLELAPVAWAATFIRAAEACLALGSVQSGFFTGLADLFGDGAFAAGGHSFTTFLQGAGRVAPLLAATALFNTWRGMQVECVDLDPAAGAPDKGPLSSPAALAGAGAPSD